MLGERCCNLLAGCRCHVWLVAYVRTQAAVESSDEQAVLQAQRQAQHMEAQLQAAARTNRWNKEREKIVGQYRRHRDIELRFFPADCFTGAIPGHVFKMGELGLGYYPDLGPGEA